VTRKPPRRAKPTPRPSAQARRRAEEQLDLLEAAHPDARIALDYETPLQLLVATILAAQNTDKHINTVTPRLFERYRSAADWAETPLEKLQEDLRPTGFFNQKAKAVQGACRALVEEHDGQVPPDVDALVALPGVGRKTANVVLGAAFGQPDRVAVDTHVKRLALRLGLTTSNKPDRIESDLEALWPSDRRTRGCHLLQYHGRRVCKARKPQCEVCSLAEACPSAGTC
jgi:endonuclease-3